MQCGCECGELLAKLEKGLESVCKCPQCGKTCDICLGTNSVLSREQIKNALLFEEAFNEN